jgi:hypothetical protein
MQHLLTTSRNVCHGALHALIAPAERLAELEDCSQFMINMLLDKIQRRDEVRIWPVLVSLVGRLPHYLRLFSLLWYVLPEADAIFHSSLAASRTYPSTMTFEPYQWARRWLTNRSPSLPLDPSGRSDARDAPLPPRPHPRAGDQDISDVLFTCTELRRQVEQKAHLSFQASHRRGVGTKRRGGTS